MSSNIHVCLISDHLMPNIIPILMMKPEKVYAITTKSMCSQGELFKKFLKRHETPVEIRSDVPEARLSGLIQFAKDEAEKIFKNHPGSKIVLNVTGGTKLMAMAFSIGFEGGKNREVDTIYTHTDHNVIEYFNLDRTPDRIPNSLVDVTDYLEARGFTVDSCDSDHEEWRNRAEARKALTLFLARKMPVAGGGFIQQLNEAANKALDRDDKVLSNPVQKFKVNDKGNKILQELVTNELIEQPQEGKIKFLSAEKAKYLRGVWLEEYVWDRLRSMGLDDVRVNVKGSWGPHKGSADNEFDCIVVHHNRMLFIECKTVFFGSGEKGQDVLNKMDALGARAKGLFGTTLLLSALQLDRKTMDRANAYKIQVLDGKNITTIQDFVLKWMKDQPATP